MAAVTAAHEANSAACLGRRPTGAAAAQAVSAPVLETCASAGQHRERLAKIESTPQLGNCGLTGEHFDTSGRNAQPVGQGLLACLGSRGVNQLEEGPCAEQVQIARVVVLSDETRAVGPGSCPGILETGEAPLVVAARTQHAIVRVEHTRMGDQQGSEREPRQQQPRRADQHTRERQPGKHRGESENREAEIRDDEMTTLPVRCQRGQPGQADSRYSSRGSDPATVSA